MRFLLLGTIEVRAGATQLALSSPRQRAVLAALLLTPNTVVAPHRLVEMVWGDAAPASAAANLRTHISQLRRQLAAVEDGGRIHARAGGYLIDVRHDELDIERFELLTEAGHRARLLGDDGRAAASFGEALQLWRGRPLANLQPTAAFDIEVQRLDASRLSVTEQRCRAKLHLGADTDVVADLQGLVTEHPLHEPLWSLLMTALAGAGRQADALVAFESIRRRLADELGTSPGRELREAHLAILRSEDTPSPSVRPAQLPRATGGFCGRAAELRALDELLNSGGASRLGVVVGSAGVGKSALTVQWAHRTAQRFPDGQLYADLQNTDDPMPVLAQFLRALGVPHQRIPREPAEAAALYRSLLAPKTLLCVLDNATGHSQIRLLLPGAPDCVTVVTSRNRLDGLVALEGARRIAVDVLTPEEATTLIETSVGADRAAAEPAAVAELAKTCAYLPLALRITSAQLGLHPARRIADHLADLRHRGVLDSLTIDGDNSAVRVAYDLSYDALAASTRRTLRLLGLIPGPDFTAAAAAALTSSTTAGAAFELGRLAVAHLVDEYTAGRYRMHDLLRCYAAERACAEDLADERDTAMTALYAYYLQRADSAADRVAPYVLRMPRPRADQHVFDTDAGARAWLRRETPNLVAAIRRAHATGQHVTTWELTDAIRGYCTIGFLPEALELAELSLDAADAAGHTDARAAAHNNLAAAQAVGYQFEPAVEHFEAALSLYRKLEHRRGITVVLQNLATMKVTTGDLTGAAAAFAAAAMLDPHPNPIYRQNLGIMYEYSGQPARAVATHKQYVADHPTPLTLLLLARAAHRDGRDGSALRAAEEALDAARQAGDACTEVHALALLARIYTDTDDVALAYDVADAALRLAREVLDPGAVIAGHAAAAGVCLRSGMLHRASVHYREALGRARRFRIRFDEYEALIGLCQTECAVGDLERAHNYRRAASRLAHENGFDGLGECIVPLVP
ncbi:AfsR/SARP family transcriptional regulator [Amycolatopsis sp. WQ 127309]|uniref:AfsR/SARP family transcriptional regulator n=1 Tax=Amycolatopsis sp. WQ 127309 TaxID=2932773 RepID=UPI001FF4C4F7|nr:AfsR/SARP family transcriptional regulator [Amycolatopsis sp. WQ 127309]UOZ10395.1 AfsR/SARP family transcriptional regulator [Amycolatopsis sp. WQ 127309]